MTYFKIYRSRINPTFWFGIFLVLSLAKLNGEDSRSLPLNGEDEVASSEHIPNFPLIFNPFPNIYVSLVQPLDSLDSPIGVIDFSFGQKKLDVNVSWDWSLITISEIIDNRQLKIPFTSSIDWYLKTMRQQKWRTSFLEVMQTEKKEDSRRGRGQMLEVVGVDIGRLGRASLNVSGNVNINGKMVFQDQELVRSTLNETQNTHLEFDQKQNLNIKGKIGDRITVAMDQDSERQFDWENNIRISYEGYEDDIIQKVEAGNISLSLPSTKYVTFSGKNQGLFGIKSISKLGPVDVTTIASIEKSKKEQSEWEGGGQSSTQQIRDVDWIKNRYFFIHPWFRTGVDTFSVSTAFSIPSFYPLRNGLHLIGDVVIKNFELYKSINTNDPNAMTGMAYVDPSDTTEYVDENEEGSFIRLEQGNNYYVSPDLGFVRVRDQVSQDILGCTFTIAHRQTGEVLLEIGKGPDESGTNLALMMLKPRNSHPNHSTWPLMFKNVYYLGTSQINPEGFEVRILNKNATPVSDRDKNSSLPYITLFGLDSLDENGNRNYDEIIDKDMANIINMVDGELMLPTLHPFADGDSLEYGQKIDQLQGQLGDGTMYLSSSSSEVNGDHRWMIEAEYTNQSSTINLGFMLIEGSEEVIQNGVTLKRGLDYSIDYFTGTIVLLGDAANDPNAKLKVNYDKHELVSFDKKTIFGTRAQMDFNNPNSFIGATALYFNQSIINEKVEVGYEPTRNFIWDVNGRYEWEMDGITRLVDRLPLIEAEKLSSFSVEGEIAQVLPNPNSINNPLTGDPNGVAFIDDFEGSKRTTSPSIQRRFWKASSAPLIYNEQDSIFIDPFPQRNRGKMYWYNPYVPYKTRDIWPNQSTSIRAGNETTDILVLRYRARDYHSNQDPDSLWVGITTSLYSGDYDQIQSKFFEIWVRDNDNPGRLHIDLGKISEDTDGNGILNTEDKPAAGLTLGNGFLEEEEDTGLDGCFDENEDGWGGCLPGGDTYAQYFALGDNQTINISDDVDENDPNGDNWYYEPPGDASKINGTESNGTGSRIQEGGKYPDTEDLDRSTFLDKTNDYFSASFMLSDTTYLAGITKKNNGLETGWRLFRVPLTDFKKVQNIEWNEIRYVRLSITGFDPLVDNQLEIAKMEIVGNEWQELGIIAPDTTSALSINNRLLNSDDEAQFQVAVINNEDNADYVPPKGVKGEYDRINQIESKEQSLALKYANLPPKHTGIAQKTLYTLNDNQKRSFMTYDYMKMYVHGDENNPWIQSNETDVEIFLRFGLADDYYEITQPVYPGWDEEESRNSFLIPLDWLTGLKQADTTNIKKLKANDKILDSLNTRQYVFTNDDGEMTGKRVKIVGQPALNRLQYFMVGVKNIGEEPINGEIWLDELRLSGIKKEKGVAMRVQSNLKLSDLGSASFIYSRQDADYHRLQERLSKSNNNSENFNFNAKLDLHRFLPRSLGISIPLNGSISQNQSKPKYFSGEDILVDPNNTPDSIMILSNTISLNTSLRKTGKSDNRLIKYTLDNLSMNFSASQSRSSDVTYSEKWTESYTGKVDYNLSFGRSNYLRPLSWSEKIPLVGKTLSEFQLYYTPTSFKSGLNLSEKLNWNETRGGSKSPETYNFGLNRTFNLDYKLTNTLTSKYSWNGQSKLNEYRGYAWLALKELDPGLVTQSSETFNTTYNPAIMKWLKPSFNYTANYRWSDDLTREGQNVSTQLRFGSNFNLVPVQVIELLYKPKKTSRNKSKSRSRNSRSRSRESNKEKQKKESNENKKTSFNPLQYLHSLTKKVNPISLSYTETLNRSANQIIGEVPTGYKFGWLPDHGLEQSQEVGSNLGTWDHKRDGSVRSGLKLTRSINISTNFSQNFSTTRSNTGIEQLSMTRDFLAYGELFNDGLPFPGWSFRVSGLEKWPIIKIIAKSASLEHGYSGKETRSWQFEDGAPEQMSFSNFGDFASVYKDNERSSRISRNFSPLIGMNMTLHKNISVTFRNNLNKSKDESPTGLTIQNDNSYTSTGTYTHRGGINFSLPFYGDINLNNTMSFTLNFDLNKSKEERSGNKTELEIGSFSESWKAGLRMSYQFSTKVSGGIRYEYRESDTRTTGRKIDRDFGFDVNLAISG